MHEKGELSIFLETRAKVKGANFDTMLTRLKSAESGRELNGLSKTRALKDQYKARLIKTEGEREVHSDALKEMPLDLRKEMEALLREVDAAYTTAGVHFLKCQFFRIIQALREGKRLEFEGFGPYLRDYIFKDMESETVKLEKADEIGLAVMAFLKREVIPEAHAVSLYDTLNLGTTANDLTGMPQKDVDNPNYTRGKLVLASENIEQMFRNFVERQLRGQGIINAEEQEGPDRDYVLISEKDKIDDAKKLVSAMDKKGLIEYGAGEEIWFQNKLAQCDDPRYLRILLRDKNGNWQCAALDASGFLNPRNREIVHLVILPKENFEVQQDQVWELLHALGFRPQDYHNIFFEVDNNNVTPASAVKAIRSQVGPLLGV